MKTKLKSIAVSIVIFAVLFGLMAPVQAALYTVQGYVYDTDGVTGVDGAVVTVTDVDTGDSLSDTTKWGGFYAVAFGWPATADVTPGDTLQIVATYGALTNTTTVTATGVSPQQVDLILVCDDTTDPVISNPQPSDGSYTNDNTVAICANYSDEVGGSGINTTSVVMLVDIPGLGVQDVIALGYAVPAANGICFDVTTTPLLVLPDGLYNVTVNVSDNCTNEATEDWSFTVDTSDPVINSVNLSDDNVTAGQSITVTVNATDDNGVASVTAEGISLTQQTAGGDTWVGDITAVVGTGVIVNVTAIDVAGNTVHDNTTTYNATVDTVNPVITSVSLSPTTVSAGQSIAVTVIATDNAGVVAVTADSILLSRTSGNATSGTWTGTITAASTSGSHTVTVIACDLYNCTTDTSQSYTVRRPPSGGGAAPPPVPDGASLSTTETGEVTASVTASSADEKAAATITAGTIAKDAAGKALTKVTVVPPAALPAGVPSGTAYVGYAYNFGPTGATFNPAIEITIEFDPAKFDKTPVIYVYEAGAWKALETTVVGNKATAMVTHFSTFVLFDEEEEVVPTVEPTTTAVPTIVPTEVPTPEPTAKLPWGLIIGIIVAVIIVGAAAYYFYTKKKA